MDDDGSLPTWGTPPASSGPLQINMGPVVLTEQEASEKAVRTGTTNLRVENGSYVADDPTLGLQILGQVAAKGTDPAAPDADGEMPDFSEVYIDETDPETTGAPPAFSSVYRPAAISGLIDAATFLVDIPTQALGQGMGYGAELLGFDETAERLRNPVTVGGTVKQVFEAPARIEEAITGEPTRIMRGFDATPRAPQSQKERFWKDVFYISGGALSFPKALAAVFKTARKPIFDLLEDANGRGLGSPAAREALQRASASGNNALQALAGAAEQYAIRFTQGLRTRPGRTIAVEQALATTAGVGYAFPEMFANDDGQIMVDLGTGEGEVDILPAAKILSSMGLPIVLAHTPTGIAITGDKTGVNKVAPLLRSMIEKGRAFAGSLVAGITDEGRHNVAARIFNDMSSDRRFLEEVFLPAVESGQFVGPGKPPPTKVLSDGSIVPENVGIAPDTLQALRQLGLDDSRLARLDDALGNMGPNGQTRLVEETRRAELLDEAFENLRVRLGEGNEADVFNAVKAARNALDKEALDTLEGALVKARDAFNILEPAIGRAEASAVAVQMIDDARLASRDVRKKLWSKDLIGTEFVDTQKFGDWAAGIIRETDRNLLVTPGMGIFYKLAGKARLEKLGILESGKPITAKDLKGVKGDGEELLKPEEIPDNGLYDRLGQPDTVYADKVKIETLQNFRSEIGDLGRAARRNNNEKLARRYSQIINYIDDELLAAKNFEGNPEFSNLGMENIRNIKIAREYTKDAKERFGPNSEIGRALYGGPKNRINEEFLNKFLRPGPGSGARVDLFRSALNEPQQVIQNGDVTWQRDPAAGLTVGGNPNVLEADLILRFTEGLAGPVTQKNVDRFLRQYAEAVDQIPGLREKFNNLKAVQQAADEMTSKLTVPSRESVIKAFRSGATIEDVMTARRVLSENRVDRALANTASDYLDADVNQAAQRFINAKPELAATRAEELAALLAKDDSGAAMTGFRAALWRALRDSSRRYDADGSVMPGVNTAKLVAQIDKNRPFLEVFFEKPGMELLDELVSAAPLQRTGTTFPASGDYRDVMSQGFAAREAVGAVGRSAGQKGFGAIGINTLVATGMGKRIAAYTFGKIGEAQIMKHVEDALRDPGKAAELIRRYRELPDWKPPASVRSRADALIDDPSAAAREGFTASKDYLENVADFAQRKLAGHTAAAIERAVRFGLIPAQGEIRRKTVEEDYESGPPFDYEDNRIRFEIEQSYPTGQQSSVQPVAPPRRRMASNTALAPPSIVPGSALNQVSGTGGAPVQQAALAAQGPGSPQVAERGQSIFPNDDIFKPLLAARGGHITGIGAASMPQPMGIMAVKRKPRQMVG